MSHYVINGGRRLEGSVTISGAKNAAVAIIPAVILAGESCLVENLPQIEDVRILEQILQHMGADVEFTPDGAMRIDPKKINTHTVTFDMVSRLRASYYLLGAMLGRYGHAEIALPGGCSIGQRPIDQHIKGFEALGAKVEISRGMIIAEAEELRGTHIYLDVVSVGATINIMMAASLARGNTIIENAAKEPHIVDVANFLNSMGANIKGAGTDVIRIKGVEKFHNTSYSIIPDQIEAGTFMTAAVATKGDIMIRNVIPKHLEAISAKLIEIGAEVDEFDDAVRVVASKRLKSTQIKTLPYPGFPTDMQPQMAVALALSKGTSVMTESIFENRFRYVDELTKMGANIKTEGNTAIIMGVERYTGARMSAPDLRAGAALVIAALAADGYSTIDQIGYILRGYEKFDEKLRSLGGLIEIADTEREVQKFKLRIG